ncbi:hypothetical protein F2P81_015398 [Scophthalmus maximus]|uniref:Uncharacterized protein n=1 Tax=Scophthalmus maximus TaxID=52904 RepID=A0A6A4SLV0_SCOMX|nr:hypothetical protein F2P81_015398 [Scophthalmus maximus]
MMTEKNRKCNDGVVISTVGFGNQTTVHHSRSFIDSYRHHQKSPDLGRHDYHQYVDSVVVIVRSEQRHVHVPPSSGVLPHECVVPGASALR